MQDLIEEIYNKILKLVDEQEYEKCDALLCHILSTIKEPEVLDDKALTDSILNNTFHEYTMKQVYDIINSDAIRLNCENYNLREVLDVMLNTKNRMNILKTHDINTMRKIVAEEMLLNKMIISSSYKSRKPNRAFLDIAFKVHPDLCSNEIRRREKVKLWKAIKSNNNAAKEEAVNRIKETLK